jgi:hypothetical protein
VIVQMGNHSKLTLPHDQRARVKQFYGGVCGCRTLESPNPSLDLYEFPGGFVVGAYFVDPAEALPEGDYIKAIWLELKTDDVAGCLAKMRAFGITELPYGDPNHTYFQGPGGQVFRLANLDGGL